MVSGSHVTAWLVLEVHTEETKSTNEDANMLTADRRWSSWIWRRTNKLMRQMLCFKKKFLKALDVGLDMCLDFGDEGRFQNLTRKTLVKWPLGIPRRK
jgi:hypothetical protein